MEDDDDEEDATFVAMEQKYAFSNGLWRKQDPYQVEVDGLSNLY